MLGKNNLECFLIYRAVAALGATVLPLNWRLSVEELKGNIDDCQPKLVFVGHEFQDTVKLIRNTFGRQAENQRRSSSNQEGKMYTRLKCQEQNEALSLQTELRAAQRD
jgi:acyl-CoA synthetase (AMP-forming)/AMP-acid ligase II